jgi:hypothetical protein
MAMKLLGQLGRTLILCVPACAFAATQVPPQNEQQAAACITSALNDSGWPTQGEILPWGPHSRIPFIFTDKDGQRSTRSIYLLGDPQGTGTQEFTMFPAGSEASPPPTDLQGLGLDFSDWTSVSSVLEQRCGVKGVLLNT